ncbi:MAG: GNAT family N-acetyltransferase [Candidatus Eisenbacteria bacterium]
MAEAGFDPVHIETERLLLRSIELSDAPGLFRIFSDPAVMRFWSTRPWDDIEVARGRVKSSIEGRLAREELYVGLFRRSDGELIGTCSLFSFHHPSRRAEIGYALARSAWGQGFMHEALLAFVAHAFSALDLNRLEADIDPRNQASARTLDRLGFRKEGALRERWIVEGEVSDSWLYGLLRSEWTRRGE